MWSACSLPAARLALDALTGGLGVNSIQELTYRTGRWALILLLVTLSFTPARRLLGWNGIIRYRRALGLAAFGYAVLHVLTYVALDLFFDFSLVVSDLVERPFITVGAAAFLLLVPLAATSNRAAIRRLGKRWQMLHRLIYPAAILAVVHFLWLVKAPAIGRPMRYGAVLAALLLVRVAFLLRRSRVRARSGAPG